jgi:hypothetical protein
MSPSGVVIQVKQLHFAQPALAGFCLRLQPSSAVRPPRRKPAKAGSSAFESESMVHQLKLVADRVPAKAGSQCFPARRRSPDSTDRYCPSPQPVSRIIVDTRVLNEYTVMGPSAGLSWSLAIR